MTTKHRWAKPVLSLVLAAALILPVPARATVTFAAFLLDAEQMDFPHRTLQVDLYRRDDSGDFQAMDTVRYTCQINRVAGEAEFHIQPQSDNVWVTVDYLTDVNGDGIYEMMDGEDSPVCDSMDRRGRLYDFSRKGEQHLDAGKTYILSADTLADRAQDVIRDWGGEKDSPLLYLVTLRHSQADGSVQELCYYLQLHDKVLPPLDVPVDAAYYDDVIYAMERGFLSGTGNSMFSPDLTLTRAHLSQILWSISGAPSAPDGGYTDVTPDKWFYRAASWCASAGLMAGTSASEFSPEMTLNREQLALILRQYIRHTEGKPGGNADLSGFSDASTVSFWAQDAMAWAVGNGLMAGDADNALHPQQGVSRAELATVLHTFCEVFDV